MEYLNITCNRCKKELAHQCFDEGFDAAATDFLSFVVEDKPEQFNPKNDYYTEGDEDAPFFSEGFLYPLLGKGDARTVLAYLHGLFRAMGLDPYQFDKAASEKWESKRPKKRKKQ